MQGRQQSSGGLSIAYRMRWKRRRLLFRALRKRRQLRAVMDRTAQIKPSDILAATTLRNERLRLPYFLEYHRKMGVDHFLMVDNDSDDGTAEYLTQQPDVSLWSTPESYRLSRFGVDWLTYLQIKYAHGHWCLSLDADEIFVYPYHQERPLRDLVNWLEGRDVRSFGALMLDMYPKGPLAAQVYRDGQDPMEILQWFDAGPYSVQRQARMQNLWIQGGPRARMFFAGQPERAPTMNKIPLVKWNRRYVYANSTHSLLPPTLNHVYDLSDKSLCSGVLLHSKFLDSIIEKSAEEKQRGEHFANSDLYGAYYDALIESPDLWCDSSVRYAGWQQLEQIGLMSRGEWR